MKNCILGSALGLAFGAIDDARAADRWSVIQISKPNSARVIDGEKGITFTVTDASVIARFGRRVKWYQIQLTHPMGGNDCPEPGRSFFTSSDRKSIELGVAPFTYCTWEVHMQWKD